MSGYVRGAAKRILRTLGLFDAAVRLRPRLKRVSWLRRRWDERRLRAGAERGGLPVPPPDLLLLVAGTDNVRWFLQGGRLAFETIRDLLGRRGVALDDIDRVLDFGCGCGRVVRHLKGLENVSVFGSDSNRSSIDWCRKNLPPAAFGVNDLSPPLACAGDEFGLVYAFSVFTHLPEQLQLAWMRELRRVTKTGGYLLITTHGRAYLDQLDPAEREGFLKNRLVVRHPEAAGTNQCGAFHPEAYVRDKLAGGFEVLEFIPEGAKGNPRQDVYLLRKLPDGDGPGPCEQ